MKDDHRRGAISVVLDASPLLLRSAGVKNYIYYWARSLAEHATPNKLELFPFMKDSGNIAHESSVMGAAGTLPRLGLLYAANVCPLPLLNWVTRQSDIFHASHQVWNPPRKSRLTSTIYDMTCWLMPEAHAATNVKASVRIADGIFRKAAGLIAISDCTRADAIRLLNLRPADIEVIYPGIATAFFEADKEQAAVVARRYSLEKPFVLYVGSIEPRKNVGILLDAWGEVARDVHDEFELVIAGPYGWGERSLQERLQAGIPGVRHLGYVPETDLAPLTAAATVFAYMSLYEGFGLPVAQALAAGVPVLTSNVSALPEVAGDAAVLVDPRSRQEVRSAMERLLLSPSLRAKLSHRGRARAREFTWEACARKSWQFFERVAA